MVIAVSLVYLGIVAAEAPYLIKNKLWRELAAFSFLLLLAIIYSIGVALNRQNQLPNLIDLMDTLFIPVTQFFENL